MFWPSCSCAMGCKEKGLGGVYLLGYWVTLPIRLNTVMAAICLLPILSTLHALLRCPSCRFVIGWLFHFSLIPLEGAFLHSLLFLWLLVLCFFHPSPGVLLSPLPFPYALSKPLQRVLLWNSPQIVLIWVCHLFPTGKLTYKTPKFFFSFVFFFLKVKGNFFIVVKYT